MNFLKEVTKDFFYKVISDMDVHLHSFFTTNSNRTYLDLRRESARLQVTEFKLKGYHLVGKCQIDYALPYDQQKRVYFLLAKYVN